MKRSLSILLVALGAGACSDGGTRMQPAPTPTAAALGRGYVERRRCAGCHDPGDGSLSGQSSPVDGTAAYGGNLTPDGETGLGGWSDDAIVSALRVAYLRALAPVRNTVPPSSCPPLKGGGDVVDGSAPPAECHRSSSGAHDVTLIDLAGAIAAGGFLVCGGKAFTGKPDLRYAGGLASTGGGLALRDGAGAARDSLGWGDATNALVRGTAAPAPPSGKSAARHPDGRDTGDNAADFTVGASTPGGPNS